MGWRHSLGLLAMSAALSCRERPPPVVGPPPAPPPTANAPTEEDFRRLYASANHCAAASDCESLGSRCGHGCYVLVHRSERERVLREEAVLRARQSVVLACSMSCTAPQPLRCEQGRCVMGGQ